MIISSASLVRHQAGSHARQICRSSLAPLNICSNIIHLPEPKIVEVDLTIQILSTDYDCGELLTLPHCWPERKTGEEAPMRKLILGTLAVTALSLPMSAFTTAFASARTPHGFTEGTKEGWKTHKGNPNVPPGWRAGHGKKEGWGMGGQPPGLRR
jgi:hypothetical protein